MTPGSKANGGGIVIWIMAKAPVVNPYVLMIVKSLDGCDFVATAPILLAAVFNFGMLIAKMKAKMTADAKAAGLTPTGSGKKAGGAPNTLPSDVDQLMPILEAREGVLSDNIRHRFVSH